MYTTTSSLEQPAPAESTCPTCHALIPVDPRYVTWCDQCGWNVVPHQLPQDQRSLTVLETFYTSLGKRFGQGLLDQMIAFGDLQPRLTLSKVLALALAVIVHAVTLAFGALGVYTMLHLRPTSLGLLTGVICLVIAWALRPRLDKSPPNILARDDTPTLYALADRIAQMLGASQKYDLIVDGRFNASFRQIGWRQRRIVALGLPLMVVLDAQEQVALIAHELAHSVNGDMNRSLLIGQAIQTLISWHRTLCPPRIVLVAQGPLGALSWFLQMGLLLVSFIPWLGAYALSHLLWRDSQRAEYLADFLAARVGGTEAMLGVLEKLQLSPTFAETVQRIKFVNQGQNVIQAFLQRVKELSPRERERLRRVQQAQMARLDGTHPPASNRAAFLRVRNQQAPAIRLSPTETEQLARELATIRTQIQLELANGIA